MQPRIYEVPFALPFTCIEIRQQRIAALKLRERVPRAKPALPHPPAELPARKIRIVEDRIEPAGLAIERVMIARGIEVRGPEAHPVHVVRTFERKHLRVDVLPPARQV